MNTQHGFACRRFFVSGRVQGVFFRASTARRANALGVRGRAVNLSDGRVEVLAVAEPDVLEAFESWLHEGPPAARVEGVEAREETLPEPLPEGFATG